MRSRRISGDYDGWGLHVWGDSALSVTSWQEPLEAHAAAEGEVEFGVWWEVEVEVAGGVDGGRLDLQVLPHKGDVKVK